MYQMFIIKYTVGIKLRKYNIEYLVYRKPAVIKLCSVCLFLNHCVNLVTVVAHHYLHALT